MTQTQARNNAPVFRAASYLEGLAERHDKSRPAATGAEAPVSDDGGPACVHPIRLNGKAVAGILH